MFKKSTNGNKTIYSFHIAKNNEPISILECFMDFPTKTLYIIGLYVHAHYRGFGFGSNILKYVMDDGKSQGLIYAELDDVSDRYGKEEDNIYYKHGFRYVCYNDGPEMKCVL